MDEASPQPHDGSTDTAPAAPAPAAPVDIPTSTPAPVTVAPVTVAGADVSAAQADDAPADLDSVLAKNAALEAALAETAATATAAAAQVAALTAAGVQSRREAALARLGLPDHFHALAPGGDPSDPAVREALDRFAADDRYRQLFKPRTAHDTGIDQAAIDAAAASLPGEGIFTSGASRRSGWDDMQGRGGR